MTTTNTAGEKLKDECFTFEDEDTVDNFDVLNDKYRNTYDWIESDQKDQILELKYNKENNLEIEGNTIEPAKIFDIINKPDPKNESQISFSRKYVPGVSDPIERLLSLKHELSDCKNEIDEFTEIFKGNQFINSNNFSDVHNEINLYKSKLDAFIDYDVFNSLKSGQDKSILSESGHSGSNNENNESNYNKSINSDVNTEKFISNYEKNTILMNSLKSYIKFLEEDFKENAFSQTKKYEDSQKVVSYEIIANPEQQINSISSKVNELESKLNYLNKLIGEWSIVSNNY